MAYKKKAAPKNKVGGHGKKRTPPAKKSVK